jgi:DNA-binding beta-propeller fold protein YncE
MYVKATVTFPVAEQHLLDGITVKNTNEFYVSADGEYTSVQYIPDDEITAFIRKMVMQNQLQVSFDALPSYLRNLTTKQLLNHLFCDMSVEIHRSNLIRAKTEYENS